MILAIETSSKQMGVAVIDGEALLASFELLAGYPHAVELPGAVTRVLQEAGASLKALEGIVVDIGPGSFTGLRIGIAFVKGLCFPTKLQVIGVSSLDVLAAGVPYAALPVCPLLDAKQGNLYAARYHLEGAAPKRETDYVLGPVDEALRLVDGPTIVLGDGCARYRDRILARCPTVQFATQELWLPRAATLARLGRARLLRGERDDVSRLVPMYLYPQDCQVRGPDRPTSVLPTPSQPA